MVYLLNQPGAQSVLIPKPSSVSGDLTMSLRSTVNNTEPIDVTVLDLALSRLYYYVAITIPEGMQPGEYEYEMKAGDEVVASGLAIMYDPESAYQYETTVEYEQYEK